MKPATCSDCGKPIPLPTRQIKMVTGGARHFGCAIKGMVRNERGGWSRP